MKTINDLLLETKTEKERFDELVTLVPEILENKKIYYSEDKYIYYDGENLHSGMDKYPKDSIVFGRFQYIFFLSSIYSAKYFSEKYKTIKELKDNKDFKLNEFGFVTIKNYGVVSDYILIRNILSQYTEDRQDTSEKLLLKKEA